jgi:hypothetical protein
MCSGTSVCLTRHTAIIPRIKLSRPVHRANCNIHLYIGAGRVTGKTEPTKSSIFGHNAIKVTDVSKEYHASIFRVKSKPSRRLSWRMQQEICRYRYPISETNKQTIYLNQCMRVPVLFFPPYYILLHFFFRFPLSPGAITASRTRPLYLFLEKMNSLTELWRQVCKLIKLHSALTKLDVSGNNNNNMDFTFLKSKAGTINRRLMYVMARHWLQWRADFNSVSS